MWRPSDRIDTNTAGTGRNMLRIAYYCQHVLGIGHFHRSLEICRELGRSHRVSLILGGPEIDFDGEHLEVCRLPGLQMDSSFRNLRPSDPTASLEETRALRKDNLFSLFRSRRPDIFIVELYPFGRKAFRFELDPVLSALREGELAPCRCYVSLRDILVERPDDREKFESRIITTLNSFFDGLLIHSDPQVVALDETFGRMQDIRVPVAYTGFITPRNQPGNRAAVRKRERIGADEKLIVVSIGGGNVGWELLSQTAAAFRLLPRQGRYRLQMFTGPYFPEDRYQELQALPGDRMRVERFSSSFPDWLAAAHLPLSMAGYNTTMNLIQAGIPALAYTFDQNREQRMRLEKIERFAAIRTLSQQDLEPKTLAGLMAEWVTFPRYRTTLRLDGAEETARLIAAGL